MDVTLAIEGLPGADLVEKGLADLEGGRFDTAAALLLCIAAPRLRTVGITIPDSPSVHGLSPEHQLYTLISSGQERGAQPLQRPALEDRELRGRSRACDPPLTATG